MANDAGATAWNKARIEALSDGIFAIAMTLLVLEIKIPDLPRHTTGTELWHAIVEHGFVFFSFFVTFLLSSLFWFWHHVCFHHIRRADTAILWINLFFLMFVSLLPFSTALLGSFTLGQPVSLAFYFGNQLALGLLLNVHWRYALSRGLVDDIESPTVRRFSMGIIAQPLACLASLAVLPFNPRQAFNAFVFVQVIGAAFIRRRLKRR